MHTRYTDKGGVGELKKYKNKLHKGSSASLLAKYLGRFCNFVCFASVSPGKVCRSFRGTKTEKKIFVALLSSTTRRRSVFSSGPKAQ